jgi:hypothetical protein
MEHGADVNASGGLFGNPLLAAACARGHNEVMSYLIVEGARSYAGSGILWTVARAHRLCSLLVAESYAPCMDPSPEAPGVRSLLWKQALLQAVT